MDISSAEFFLGVLLALLLWVLPVNPLYAAITWIIIGGLSFHLVLGSPWFRRWNHISNILVCVAIAILVGWKAQSAFNARNTEAQIVMQKFDLHPFKEGKPLRVGIVVINKTLETLAVKTYGVTSLRDSPKDLQEELQVEEKLHLLLRETIEKRESISTEIPPSLSYFHTMEVPMLTIIEKDKLDSGRMRFYFLGAMVHKYGKIGHCHYTSGDRVIRLCRRQS